MIIDSTNTSQQELVGVKSTSGFGVKFGSKLFRALSDTMYTNKIGSLVREICCNAMDSHIVANKSDVPFNITLPTLMSPIFVVEDFGTGMSPETIEKIYSTYFESTKDNSNTEVGGFGLGGKSPYAYTDSFFITSYYNGKEYAYSAHLDTVDGEEGVPVVSLMDVSDTERGNGVTISIPVKVEDAQTFSFEVHNQLAYFETKPKVSDNTYSYEFEEHTYSLESGIIKFVDTEKFYRHKVVFVQGGVGYPVDYRTFLDILNKNDIDSSIFIDELSSPVFYFDIGDIEVTINREAISFSEKTIRNLIDAVNEFLTTIKHDTIKTFSNAKTRWDVACLINGNQAVWSAIKKFKLFGEIFDSFGGKENLKIDGRSDSDSGARLYFDANLSKMESAPDHGSVKCSAKTNYTHYALTDKQGLSFTANQRCTTRSPETRRIFPTPDTVVIYADVSPYTPLIDLLYSKGKLSSTTAIQIISSKEQLNDHTLGFLSAQLGDVEVVRLSSYGLEYKKERKKTERVAFNTISHGWYNKSNFVKLSNYLIKKYDIEELSDFCIGDSKTLCCFTSDDVDQKFNLKGLNWFGRSDLDKLYTLFFMNVLRNIDSSADFYEVPILFLSSSQKAKISKLGYNIRTVPDLANEELEHIKSNIKIDSRLYYLQRIFTQFRNWALAAYSPREGSLPYDKRPSTIYKFMGMLNCDDNLKNVMFERHPHLQYFHLADLASKDPKMMIDVASTIAYDYHHTVEKENWGTENAEIEYSLIKSYAEYILAKVTSDIYSICSEHETLISSDFGIKYVAPMFEIIEKYVGIKFISDPDRVNLSDMKEYVATVSSILLNKD